MTIETHPETPSANDGPTVTVYVHGPPLSQDQLEGLEDQPAQCSTRDKRGNGQSKNRRCAGIAVTLVLLAKEGGGYTRLAACPEHHEALLTFLREQGAEVED